MNIETVNELIASLEAAGELSIKETKVMALAKAFKQMAAENVALKSAIETHKHGFVRCNCCGDELMCHTDDVCRALDEIPATDRIVAGIKADGVEEFAKHCDDSIGFVEPEDEELYMLMEEQAREYAKQLREGAQ
ncbi:hypothetical protein AAHX80_06555 [Klebsiella variicola subsp. variicola]|uniref:hypothetical protein n=1 Tax=Klebsiella variicola TaxID=244366 RepID=UPI0035B68EC6